MDSLFSFLDVLENALWGYIGFPLIVLIGVYFTYVSRFAQIRSFPKVVKTFWFLLTHKDSGPHKGIHPLKAFFASIGGSVGVGNIVAITSAVQIGGPGALFWIWMTAIAGSLVKYSEVYLAMTTRYACPKDGFLGGPMYVLQKAFKGSKVPGIIFSVLMCIYGVEIYQFSVVSSTLSSAIGCPNIVSAICFLIMVIYAERGGINRVGAISSWLIPTFILIYLSMGTYFLFTHSAQLPAIFSDVFKYAFEPCAAQGGFVGSTLLLTISQGLRRGCYSSDIGVGYASIIHSESSVEKPARQASLLIFEVFLDSFVICTMSVLLVLVTGTWKMNFDEIHLVQESLATQFPFASIFMPFFLFLVGYSTIIAYFSSGMLCAKFISPRYGRKVYYVYAVTALLLFSLVHSSHAICVMALVQFGLLTLNVLGMWKLRHEISYDIPAIPNVASEENTVEYQRTI